MSFLVYDISFLVIFTLVVSFLLYKNRKNVSREMKIAFLYRAQWGIKMINYIGTHYKKTLKFLKWVILPICYILMIGIIIFLGQSVYSYVTKPILTEIVKAPPLAPVIPYFPALFGMQSFFPDFYFTYFIVALGIVAIVHEFSHGIFMRHNKVRIKSTGLAFFGPFMGAFVEQNDEDMTKLKKIDQMTILGAGVFANVIFAIIFLAIWILLFYVAFSPVGATFNIYTLETANISQINKIAGVEISNNTKAGLLEFIKEEKLKPELVLEDTNPYLWPINEDGKDSELLKIDTQNRSYLMTKEGFEELLKNNKTTQLIVLYGNYPAIRNGLKGTIVQVNEERVDSYGALGSLMDQYEAGDKIKIKTRFNGEYYEYDMVLDSNQNNKSRGVFGISNIFDNMRMDDQLAYATDSLMKKINSNYGFKQQYTEYEIKNEFLVFLYYLAFWVFLINALVALFNMLPAAILDGGRFFYLTIWGITRSEKTARVIYKIAGYIILAAFALMMIIWAKRIFL